MSRHALSNSKVNAFHPVSSKHASNSAKLQNSKRNQMDTEQKAPKSEETVISYTSDPSRTTTTLPRPPTTVPSTQREVANPHLTNTKQQDPSELRRFRNPQRPKQTWKIDPERAQSTKFSLQKARCAASTSPQQSATEEIARN